MLVALVKKDRITYESVVRIVLREKKMIQQVFCFRNDLRRFDGILYVQRQFWYRENIGLGEQF